MTPGSPAAPARGVRALPALHHLLQRDLDDQLAVGDGAKRRGQDRAWVPERGGQCTRRVLKEASGTPLAVPRGT